MIEDLFLWRMVWRIKSMAQRGKIMRIVSLLCGDKYQSNSGLIDKNSLDHWYELGSIKIVLQKRY